jgi:hypothetical protein
MDPEFLKILYDYYYSQCYRLLVDTSFSTEKRRKREAQRYAIYILYTYIGVYSSCIANMLDLTIATVLNYNYHTRDLADHRIVEKLSNIYKLSLKHLFYGSV